MCGGLNCPTKVVAHFGLKKGGNMYKIRWELMLVGFGSGGIIMTVLLNSLFKTTISGMGLWYMLVCGILLITGTIISIKRK